MNISQEMDPTALVQPLMTVVSCVEIAAQSPLEVFPNQRFDHFSRPRAVVLVEADGWGVHTPDVAIEAIFSPSGFIGLHSRAGSDLCFEVIEHGLGMGHEAVEHLDNLSD